MKIIIEDGFSIEKGTGIGNHTIGLLYNLKLIPDIQVTHFAKIKIKRIKSRLIRRILYSIWLDSVLQIYLKTKEYDIIHFTNYTLPLNKLGNTKYAVTIHDLTAWKCPDTLPYFYKAYIKFMIFNSIRLADIIFTVSNSVKKDLIEIFNIDPRKIVVAYNGIDKNIWARANDVGNLIRVKKKYAINKEYILFVGTLEKRKNLLTLIKAFEIVKKYKDLHLLLVGNPGFGFEILSEYLNKSKIKNDIIILGYVSEFEKINLYDSAILFAFPSIYEGFGIPLVEAMSRGVPIVASKIPSSEEVLGECAVYYENYYDHKQLAEKIIEILNNRKKQSELRSFGIERSKKFYWELVINEYVKAYSDALMSK